MAALVCGVVGPGQALGATLTVNNANDSGSGSLRQAIQTANASTAPDTITFSIGTGAHTITLSSALPAITNSVVIDATTQPGYADKPLIELSGASVGSGSGLWLAGGSNTVRGLIINGFPSCGLDVEGGGTNVIAGNYIGTDSSGTTARPNHYEGIYVNGTSGNLIGGTNASDRNVISGNGEAGILLYGSSNNVIRGNYIGTTVAGTAALGNTYDGIALFDAPFNVVGGTNANCRNVISGNGASGVYLYDMGAASNVVQGNYIGTDVTGSLALGNNGEGLTLYAAPNNSLGGSAAGAGNLISANSQNGVGLYGPGLSNNLVQGNLIGTTAAGTTALGNGYAGVWMSDGTNNWIGGLATPARNVIAGNHQDGVVLSNCCAVTLAGNSIGLNASGAAALANGFNGITLMSCSSNVIGGAAASARNLISGNSYYGVHLLLGGLGNTLQGNFIGTDASGRAAVKNQLSGVRLEAALNTIGGVETGAGNLISGNGQDGLFVVGVGAGTNLIQGNSVGTTVGGTNGLGNGRSGIGLSGAPANTVGGSVAGAGNIISANGNAGLYLLDRTAAGNQILGNRIGTDPSGLLPLGNAFEGIYASNVVSTILGGPAAGAGNVIAANHLTGVYLLRAAYNTIQGNWIGTGIDGVTALGNGESGIDCDTGSTNNLIGGSAAVGNRIAFSPAPYAGVRVRTGAVNNRITGNGIFGNGALGIDLGPAGVTQNDTGDADTGGNNLQNFPVLTGVVAGHPTWVRGTLNSTSGTNFLLEFFANPAADASGYGQGQLYLGEATVTTGADGKAAFLVSFPVTVLVGYSISATATDPTGNTSEFSAGVSAGPVPRLTAIPAANRQLTLSWTNTAAGFALQQAPSLTPPIQWTAVTNLPTIMNGQCVVTLTTGGSNLFYRLSFQ